MELKILSPKKSDLSEEIDKLSPVRFKYKGKIYENDEPYFMVLKMAKQKYMSIEGFLYLEVSNLKRSKN
jgi:hypothetical protein